MNLVNKKLIYKYLKSINMKTTTFFISFFFSAFLLVGMTAFSQDVDYTDLIINNDFEYQSEGVLNPSGTSWKPLTQNPATTFYGWTCDFSVLGGTSQGLNQDFSNTQHDVNGCWIASSNYFPSFFEFYQIINKNALSAGTYKVQCLLAVGSTKRTNQRLFANQNVQYFASQGLYPSNQVEGEIATFANSTVTNDKLLQEMVVYTTIGENDSLKIGIRTSGKKGDGQAAATANPAWGWFKVDYFRLTKIDPIKAANANLTALSLTAGEINFESQNTTYDVTLPEGTISVTPTATAEIEGVTIGGTAAVDVSSGSGTSNIIVTALDGSTQKTYTINYTVDNTTNLTDINRVAIYTVKNGKLTVKGVDSYSVFRVNGIKVAEVKNSSEEQIDLKSGVYIIKTKESGIFKVVVE